MSIIQQLAALSEAAPDICQKAKFGRYQVGEYYFGENPNGTLHAIASGNPTDSNDALDLLTGALMRAIEAQGWNYDILYDADLALIGSSHWVGIGGGYRVAADSKASALLAALLAALEMSE